MVTKERPLPKELSAPCTTIGGDLSVCTSHSAQSLSSSLPFDRLTDDLLTEILLRVPIKPLYRSKCVSKHWLSFISSTCFARSYIITDHHNDMLLFRTLHNAGKVYALPLLPGAAYPHVSSIPLTFDFVDNIWEVTTKVLWRVLLVGSYGGLVLLSACFQDYHAEKIRQYCYYQYYLCNPVSKQWVELPLIPTCDTVGFTCYHAQQARGQDGISRIWADTDSYEEIIRNNVDYDPNKIDFTVVSINWNNEKGKFMARVFSSTDETAEWSIFHVPCPPGSRWTGIDLRAKLVFLNGKFHWCGTNCIAAYDPFNKPLDCDIIPLPPRDPVKSGTYTKLVLEACEGRLRLVKDFFTGRFVVWDLVDYANKVWVQKFDVDTDLGFQSFVGVVARDKVYMLSNYSSAIKLFDVRNKSEQHVYDHITSDNNVYKLRSVTPFFSSPWPTPVAVGQKKLLSYINFP
ncbi:putative F-box/kelch-repeat protein At4g22430 [Silene latifolia]|uniref:putative F-box/kelch-repeat protein At4g22430 n=1 Tax=Silene latifolia TaxID=37657 RepID=UPI003D76BAA8